MSEFAAAAIATVFSGPGVSTIQWEQGRRCRCYAPDTEQPKWGGACPFGCEGFGVLYGPLTFPADASSGFTFAADGSGITLYSPVQVKGLFRSQSRFMSPRLEGELQHGEAALTTPTIPVVIGGVEWLPWKPNYVDRRVRDRLTILNATGDQQSGRVFYPAAKPVPFLIGDEQLAWRVQLQALEQTQRVQPQP